MYKIDPTSNRISPIQAKRFSDLGFTERKHLQELLEILKLALARYSFQSQVVFRLNFQYA